MRSMMIGAGLVLALLACELAIWITAPERRLVRSAVAAGIVAGRCTASAAW